MLKQIFEEENTKKQNIFNTIQHIYTMNTYPVDNVHLNELHILKQRFTHLKSQLTEVTLLELNDKLGFDEQGNMFIDKNDTMQCIRRWYFNQNRNLLLQYLPQKLDTLIKFVDIMLGKLNNQYNFYLFRMIGLGLINFTEGILQGLQCLDTTYTKDTNIHTLLDKYSIILEEKLNDLKQSKGITHILYSV